MRETGRASGQPSFTRCGVPAPAARAIVIGGGENAMRCAVILSVIVGSAIAVSPAAAQVAVGDAPAAQQPTSADTSPPPFPAMPRARPSSRCVNTCGGKSKSVHRSTAHHETAKSRHSVKSAHHATSSRHHGTKARKEAERKNHKKTRAHEPALHLSHAAIRRCHKEDYRQLMNDGKCRALMAEELKAREPHHRSTRHKSSSTHKSSSPKKKTEHRATRHHSKHR